MVHILHFFEKSSQKLKQTIWASQKCKNDIKYENPGENGPLGQKLGHFATMYPYSSPDHIYQYYRCTTLKFNNLLMGWVV